MKIRTMTTGFAGLLLLLALLPAAAMISPAQTTAAPGPSATDQQIQRYLQNEFAKKSDLKQVNVHVEDRIATLSGSVPSYRALLNSVHIAQQVESVNGVVNRITVNAPYVPDDKLREEIAERLTYDRMGQGQTFNNLTISVHDGVVTLGGQVIDYPDRDSALAIADDTKGVKRVIDHIEVAPLSPFDDQIRFQAARAIYGNPSLRRYELDPAHPIRIVVKNGHVTLDGVVNSQVDKQLAQSSLAGINGILGITNNLVVAR